MSEDDYKAIHVEIGYLQRGQDEMKKDINELFNMVRDIQMTLAEKRGVINAFNVALVVGSSTIAVVVAKMLG